MHDDIKHLKTCEVYNKKHVPNKALPSSKYQAKNEKKLKDEKKIKKDKVLGDFICSQSALERSNQV